MSPPRRPLRSQPVYVASCWASGPGRSMQKFRACRKRCWPIQRRLSTSSCCITAIWPGRSAERLQGHEEPRLGRLPERDDVGVGCPRVQHAFVESAGGLWVHACRTAASVGRDDFARRPRDPRPRPCLRPVRDERLDRRRADRAVRRRPAGALPVRADRRGLVAGRRRPTRCRRPTRRRSWGWPETCGYAGRGGCRRPGWWRRSS